MQTGRRQPREVVVRSSERHLCRYAASQTCAVSCHQPDSTQYWSVWATPRGCSRKTLSPAVAARQAHPRTPKIQALSDGFGTWFATFLTCSTSLIRSPNSSSCFRLPLVLHRFGTGVSLLSYVYQGRGCINLAGQYKAKIRRKI
jgi:hypothetical protein